MKKTKSLTILLNVFAVLSLAYTCYAAIQAYNTFISYYSTNIDVLNLVMYISQHVINHYALVCFFML